ncbi:unnamed protein product [Caretta caretta]
MKKFQSLLQLRNESAGAYGFPEGGEMLSACEGGFLILEKSDVCLGVDAASQVPKKRKRCGLCVPCLRKGNCGACTHCVNRRTSHQICKMRKCEALKKKKSVLLKKVEVGDNKEGGTQEQVLVTKI